ncbi:schwannomin-interacting protein 1 [Perca flavescens]|uniref:schwannomin-interacting protein 1 n=1 Tax=Perca flavescens TaxID=8167 RepID=UPI00106E5532|nr:schwannomin-interacting protein 1-like [Perca flavescens]
MEGQKETAEEKEEEEELHHHHHHHHHHHIAAAAAAAVASSVDYQGLPIMHWEDLSQHIAELEKQEQERRERSKSGTGGGMEDSRGGEWTDLWEEEEEEEHFRKCRVAVVTSRLVCVYRLHNHRKLQLCFVNDSDSEEEEEEEGSNNKRKVSMGTGRNGCHVAGLKQEVATALRTLRDKLLAEQRESERPAGSSRLAERKHLERRELLERSVQQLSSMRASLQQAVHALSSELVTHLLVRDQLRTKQDAMLLDVQDLT